MEAHLESIIILSLIPILFFIGIIARENFIKKAVTVKSRKTLSGIIRKKTDIPVYPEYPQSLVFSPYTPDLIPYLPEEIIPPIKFEHDIYVENQSEGFTYKIMVPNNMIFDSFSENQKVTIEIEEVYYSYPRSIFKDRRQEKFFHWELSKIYS